MNLYLVCLVQIHVIGRVVDMGGQQHYDFLKPLLLRHRALLVFVWSARNTKGYLSRDIKDTLRELGGFVEQATVVLFFTHLDQCTSFPTPKACRQAMQHQLSDVLGTSFGHVTVFPEVAALSTKGDRKGLQKTLEILRRAVSKVFLWMGFQDERPPAVR